MNDIERLEKKIKDFISVYETVMLYKLMEDGELRESDISFYLYVCERFGINPNEKIKQNVK